jgi:SAM-dependent methyltransferase
MTPAAFLSTKTGQFTYFALQVGEPVWRGKDVLDFGGNMGNILRDPNSTIDEEHYWCLDVVEDAVEKGRQAYPKSHWIFYDRYCFYFNPHGIRGLPLPDLDRKFDYIVAYSVFTNTTVTDMLQLETQLESILVPGGVLAFTFIDPNYFSWPDRNNLQWRLELERKRGNISDG